MPVKNNHYSLCPDCNHYGPQYHPHKCINKCIYCGKVVKDKDK